MDGHLDHKGATFVWNKEKARRNQARHGVRFDPAVEVFFDPLPRLVDASRQGETRDAVIGDDAWQRLLYVVHLLVGTDAIRMVPARKATADERTLHVS